MSSNNYFASSPRETLAWLIYGAAGCVLGWVFTHQLEVHERPIPAQAFTTTAEGGEFVFVHDLSFDLLRPDKDTVSTILTYILAGLVPILAMMGLAYKYGPRTDVTDILTVYLVTFGTSLLAVEPVKWYVSWLRPNFYEMCEPDQATYTICESDEPSGEARHSFPSGHAVTAFSGLTLLTYYVHFRFGLAAYLRQLRKARKEYYLKNKSRTSSDDKKEEEEGSGEDDGEGELNDSDAIKLNRAVLNRHRIISMVGLIFPQGLALFIGASRIRDNRHFPADVIAGALIGAICALFVAPLWWMEETHEDFP